MCRLHIRIRQEARLPLYLVLVGSLIGLPAPLLSRATGLGGGSKWKVFSNRSGWSVVYPADWRIASCQLCPDPKDPKVFVDFLPPIQNGPSEGWVMIEHLRDKPPDISAASWLSSLERQADANPIIARREFVLNGAPALKVLTRNQSTGSESETVYVISGEKSFAISFNGAEAGATVQSLGNYPTYLRILSSFRVKH